MKKYLFLIALSLTLITCKKDIEKDPEIKNNIPTNGFTNVRMYLNSINCYLNGNLKFECADVIEISPNILFAVLANDRSSLSTSTNIPYYLLSYDGGSSWSLPQQMNITNPNNWQFQHFNLLKISNTIYMIMHRVVGSWEGGLPAISESHDNGLTWTEPTLINFSNPQEEDMIIIASRNITQTQTGRIVIPVASSQSEENVYTIYKDSGDTIWHKSNFLKEVGAGFAEPTIAQLNGGGLIMLIRTKKGFIYKSYSSDGTTWSTPVTTTLQSPSTAHTLRVTTEGYLIVAFSNAIPDAPGSGYPRTNITTAVSFDNGATWGQYTVVEIHDMVMEPSLTLFGNKILITFLQNEAGGTSPTIQTRVYDTGDLINVDNKVTEDWNNTLNNWTASSNGTTDVIRINKKLHLSNYDNSLTTVYKNESFSSNYSLEFKAKINNFFGSVISTDLYSTTLGLKVGDGQYRLMLRLEEDGIYVMDNTGDWAKKTCAGYVNTKYDWHIWKVNVNNGSAEIFMDGSQVVSAFNLEATSAYAGRIEYWTRANAKSTDYYIDYSYLTDISNSLLISNDWNSLSSWTSSGTGIKEIIDTESALHFANTNNTTTSIYRNLIIPNSYNLEFRAKINSFIGPINSSNINNTTLGIKVGNGQHRLMLRLEEDGIYVIDNTGNWIQKTCTSFVNTKNNWHTWNVSVNSSGSTEISMDGVLVVSAFYLEATSYNSGRIEHWTTSTSSNPTDSFIDYTYLY